MVITSLFTTRLKIITLISALIIFCTLFLFGYELGWRSAISTYEKKQKIINAKSIKNDDKKNLNLESNK